MPPGKSWQQIGIKHGISRGRACHKFKPYRERMLSLMRLWHLNWHNTRQRLRMLHDMTEADPDTAKSIVMEE